MSVIISTSDLLTLFQAARITSYKGKDDPALVCAHLSSVRIEDPSGSGTTDAITAVSTDGLVAGQITFPVEGTIKPLLIDLTEVPWLEKMLVQAKKNMAELEGKNSDFTASLTVSAEGMLIVETLTNGMKGEKDVRGEINLGDASSFPIIEAMGDLENVNSGPPRDADNKPIPEGRLQSSTRTQTDVEAGAQKVFKEQVNKWTLGHLAGRRVMTCAGVWRAVVPGDIPDESMDPNEPDVATVVVKSVPESDD